MANKYIIKRQSARAESVIRNALGGLLLLLAINAFGGGYYGMAGAAGVPLEWLKGSLFQSYFLPGLFLFIMIGGLSVSAAVLVFRRHAKANILTSICGIVVLGWLTIQVAIIGYVSWMQPVTAFVVVAILFLNYKLKRYVH